VTEPAVQLSRVRRVYGACAARELAELCAEGGSTKAPRVNSGAFVERLELSYKSPGSMRTRSARSAVSRASSASISMIR